MTDKEMLTLLKEGRVNIVIEYLENQVKFEDELSDFFNSNDEWPDFVDGSPI